MWRCAGCEKVGNRRTPLSPRYACSKAMNKLNLFIYTLSNIIEFIVSSVKVAERIFIYKAKPLNGSGLRLKLEYGDRCREVS